MSGAEKDLEAIYDCIADFDCLVRADHGLDQLMKVVTSRSHSPERFSYPKELLALGIKEYRQTDFKLYRVIYRAAGFSVTIHLIVEGRRNKQSVLAHRLLGT
jgi:toxin ParE1/3/4